MLRLNIYLNILFANCFAYKILIYSPQIGHSHVSFFAHIADTLVEAGHDVVLYVPAYYDGVNTTAAKLARIVTRPLDHKLPYATKDILSDAWTQDGCDILQVFKLMIGTASNIQQHCEMQLADQKLLDKFRDEHFDVGIAETFTACGFALFHKIGIRTHIGGFATNLVDYISFIYGVENNPSYVPASFTQLNDVMSYGERWINMASYLTTIILAELFYRPYMNFRGTAPGFSLFETISKNEFAFVNSEELLEYPRPISHKIVFIGGIGISKTQPLSEDYTRIMDQAKGPVVLISFGSVANSSEMPLHIKQAFVGMFKQLPEVTFIWKYEVDDNITVGLENLIIRKWVPQSDLFAHPKLGAFITHGGLNSVTESVHMGIPMICVPLFGDQMRNAKLAEKRHIAVVLDKRYITTDSLADAVRTVLYNETYNASAKRLARMIAKKPISARDRLVKYTEFAAEFGPFDNLNSAGVNLNFLQFHSIDVIVPAFVGVVLFSALAIYMTARLLRSMINVYHFNNKWKKE